MTHRDAPLIEAEQQLRAARSAGTDAWEIAPTIHATAPHSWTGAAIKLRLLCDADLGIPAGPSEEDLKSLREVLEFAEREERKEQSAREQGAPLRPIAADATPLQIMIEVEYRIRSMGVKISDAADGFRF
jgi:hypothetical protein